MTIEIRQIREEDIGSFHAAVDAVAWEGKYLALLFATNTRAVALYRKAGFVEEGMKRCAILINGIFHDEIIMARLRD